MVTTGSRSTNPGRDDGAFLSVFPPKDHTVPTPQATPTVGTLSSPARSFGGFNIDNRTSNTEAATLAEAAAFSRAWSVATRCLALPPGLDEERQVYLTKSTLSPEFSDALTYIVQSPLKRGDLDTWYHHEVGLHFKKYVLPKLSFWRRSSSKGVIRRDAFKILSDTVDTLYEAQTLYLRSTRQKGALQSPTLRFLDRRFSWIVKNIFRSALPSHQLVPVLEQCLGSMIDDSLCSSNTEPQSCLGSMKCTCATQFDLNLLARLAKVGLAEHCGQRALFNALKRFFDDRLVYKRCFAVEWTSRSSSIPKLRRWILEEIFPSLQRAINALNPHTADGSQTHELEQESIVKAAIRTIGASRCSNVFDYIQAWPESEGAILDIKDFLNIGTVHDKQIFCASFSNQMNQRLLHAGASTTEILGIYVNVIHAMTILDSRGTILNKVAIPIRGYLRTRDDAADVIAKSFLAKFDGAGGIKVEDEDEDIVCTDITRELAHCTLEARDTRALNWSDMNWEPDPIDAGPDYKSSKADDVVAHIFDLFDHDDDLISAITRVLGTHLRRTKDTELLNETKLVELLKSRLDNAKLQNIEVMLKDMRESILLNRRANPKQHKQRFLSEPDPKEIQSAIPEDGITLQELYSRFKSRMGMAKFSATVKAVAQKRNDLYFAKRTRLVREGQQHSATQNEKDDIMFDAKVLSGYFWPQTSEPSDLQIDIPRVETHKQGYAKVFNSLSGQRKLEWMPDQDTMDIEIELEDRTLQIKNVLAWMWKVLQVFSDAPEEFMEDTAQASLSISEVSERSQMDEELVYAAVAYWIGKDVLYQPSAGAYAILECKADLDMDVEGEDGQGEDASMLDNFDLDEVQFRKQVPLIESCVKNMLGASGGRNVQGITMMLTMMMPGFTYGDGEVTKVLQEMSEKGETMLEGDVWKMVG